MRYYFSYVLVGLPGFEPGSLTPEAKSLDQTSRQPQNGSLTTPSKGFGLIVKTYASIQHLSETSQKAVIQRLKRISKGADLQKPNEVNAFVFCLNVSNNYKNKLFYAYQHLCKANRILYNKPKKLRVDARDFLSFTQIIKTVVDTDDRVVETRGVIG